MITRVLGVLWFAFWWLLFVLPAHAASFDCSQATTPIEKTICADPHLSALDDELNQAYQIAIKKAGDGIVVVRHEQRAWLSDLKERCTGDQIRSCIEQAENDRIQKLRATVAPNPASVTDYKITNASRYFDFEVRIFAKPAETGDNTREGPGLVIVYTKGSPRPLQTVMMDNIVASSDKDGHPLINTAKLYDYQGLINVGDFNFDGHEDFAVQNGNNGAYAGPSYDVYLYVTTTNLFQFNKPLTALIEESLGFFDVDPSKKLLTTFSKDGCCYHTITTYTVVNNKAVPVSREIEDASKSDKYAYVSDQRMVNGKWQGASRRVLQDKAR